MEIYLAGGYSGNLRKMWTDIETLQNMGREEIAEHYAQKLFIKGGPITQEGMELYLAGRHPCKNGAERQSWEGLNILESFYYLEKDNHFPRLCKTAQNFLLDSGAYTFMSNSGTAKIDWDDYVERFASFINKHDIKLFFELDIDSLVGIKEVERLRIKLERLTNKQSIPVWHVSRGKEYFLKMCDNYSYVAFGGLITDGVPKAKLEAAFPWFISEAHKRGAKIHGLGYTSMSGLHKFRFDSVDSTAWIYGNMGGYVYKFDPVNGVMQQINAPQGKKLKGRMVALHNFNEWVRFLKYARLHL